MSNDQIKVALRSHPNFVLCCLFFIRVRVIAVEEPGGPLVMGGGGVSVGGRAAGAQYAKTVVGR